MKLEIKHLSPYLPYGLGLYYMDTKKIYPLVVHNSTVSMQGGFNINEVINEPMLKPILRPMSDLNKMIPTKHGEVNLVSKLDLVKDEDGDWCDEVQADQCESPSVLVPINAFNWWLFESHFDVFGLIDAGLAIDINTLENGN